MGKFFRKFQNNKYTKELFILSDDETTLVYVVRSNEKVYYGQYGEIKSFINRGWLVYIGDYDKNTDNIVQKTKKIMFSTMHISYIFGRLIFLRKFLKATSEYLSDFKTGYNYDNAIKIWERDIKETTINGMLNAISYANPDDIDGFGFSKMKELVEDKNIKNKKYFIMFTRQIIKDRIYFLPLCVACSYDYKDGKKILVERLPDYKANYLFLKFFMTFVEYVMAAYPGIRVYYNPNDILEKKECIKYEFTPTETSGEYSVTEDEMYAIPEFDCEKYNSGN